MVQAPGGAGWCDSGGGANLHIHRSVYSKWGKGVELHSSYFKAWENYFHKKKFKYVILMIKEEF